MSTEQKETKSGETEIDFHGAAVVDEHGNEVEITETMVQQAISELETKESTKRNSGED